MDPASTAGQFPVGPFNTQDPSSQLGNTHMATMQECFMMKVTARSGNRPLGAQSCIEPLASKGLGKGRRQRPFSRRELATNK